jgi:D-glycero-D-manno-heptose 1,7-bisphosphate phosphatase
MAGLIFLDRDGTINVEKHYLSSPDQIELLPRAAEGMRMMRDLGLQTVVVTNQSGVGRGYFGIDVLDRIHQRLGDLLASEGASPGAIYVCPHRPEDLCECRKPSSFLALKAAELFGADISQSFVIGDNTCDIEMGQRLGATTILVRTGYGARIALQPAIKPDYVVEDLAEAARVIGSLIGSATGVGLASQDDE